MTNLIFIIQAQIVFTIGYLVYMLLFRKGVHLQARRIFLLLLPFIAVCIPLIQPQVAGSTIQLPTIQIDQASQQSLLFETPTLSTGYWSTCYLVIASIIFVWMMVKIAQMLFTNAYAVKQINAGCFIVEDPKISIPFSFFRTIYLPSQLGSTAKTFILAHELVHVKQWHSLDVVYMHLLRSLNWINPLSWMMFNELKLVHECIADEQASKENVSLYAELLLAQQFNLPAFPLTNNFNRSSQLKQRLMMLQSISPKRTWLRIGMILPCILAISLLQLKASPASLEQKHISQADTIPTFNGGQEALINYLVKEIKYPEAAQKDNIQGTVVVSFTVNKKGSVEDAKVVKGVNTDLDSEALRVVEAMPKWTPAEKNGKKVAGTYILPIAFRLN